MVWIKRIFILVTTLIVVAVCALAVFILSFDANAYKSDLQWLVKERTDRDLTIAGDLKVVLFPELAITVRDLTLSEPGRPDRFASIDELRASMELLPLLKNRIVIDELEASGIRADLVRRQDGKLSIDDLFKWSRGEEGTEPGPELMHTVDAMTIDVAGIQISDSEIRFRDEQRQSAWTVSGLSLTTGHIVNGEPVEVKLAAKIRDETSGQGASVTAKALLAFDAQSGHFAARDLVVGAKGDWPGMGWLPEPVAGLEVVLRTPHVVYETESARVRVERLAVRAKGQRLGNPVEFALDTPALVWGADAIACRNFTGRLKVDGPLAMDVSFVGEGMTGGLQAVQVARLDTDLTVKRESRTNHTFLSSPVQVQLQPLVVTLPEIRGGVKIKFTDPGVGDATVSIKGRLAVASSELAGGVSAGGAGAVSGAASVSASSAASGAASVSASSAAPASAPVSASGAAGAVVGKSTARNAAGTVAKEAAPARRLISVRGGFESIPFSNAWTGLGIDSPLDGVANVQFDLKGTAGGTAKFEESLAGTVQLKIEDAAVRGIDFAEGLEALRAIAKPSAEGLQFKGNPAKRTRFETVDLAMRVNGPLATLTKLELNGSNWRLGLGKPAEVNLRDGTADLGVTLYLRNPQPLTVGKVTVDVRSLVVPLRLSGSLSDPVVNIDWKDLGRDRLGMALRQKLLEGTGAGVDGRR